MVEKRRRVVEGGGGMVDGRKGVDWSNRGLMMRVWWWKRMEG